MNPSAAPPAHSRFEVRTTSDSHFSWIRTRLSIERTLMSWVRTAVSLIGFGFTIVQFFEKFSQMQGVKEAVRPHMARYLGLALIASGVLSLGISIWQYVSTLNYLRSPEFAAVAPEKPAKSPLLLLAIVLVAIGLFAFCSVLFRLT
jgi:putative membrane protein